MSQINESAIATPGVYVTEIPAFPPSIAQVATAVPVFIGYTPQAVQNGKPVFNTAVRISSLIEFTTYFGTGFNDLQANVILNADNSVNSVYFSNASITSSTYGFQLFNTIQMFFNNGGSNCYIIALPFISGSPNISDFTSTNGTNCFDIIQKQDEPTLIVIPDAVLLNINGFNNLMNASLNLCRLLQDRFTIMDVYNGDKDRDFSNTDIITVFRNGVSGASLNYGAVYYPWLRTSLAYSQTNPNSIAYGNIIFNTLTAKNVPLNTIILNNSFLTQLDTAIKIKANPPNPLSTNSVNFSGGKAAVSETKATGTITIGTVVPGDTFILQQGTSPISTSYTAGAADSAENVATELAALVTIAGFTATAVGSIITVSAPAGSGASLNAIALSAAITGASTATGSNFEGGVAAVPETTATGTITIGTIVPGDTFILQQGTTPISTPSYTVEATDSAEDVATKLAALVTIDSFTATAVGSIITVSAPTGSGASLNTIVLSAVITGTSTAIGSNFEGGIAAVPETTSTGTVTIGTVVPGGRFILQQGATPISTSYTVEAADNAKIVATKLAALVTIDSFTATEAGSIITVSAPAGSGNSLNTVVLSAAITGSLTIGSKFAGGVDAVPAEFSSCVCTISIAYTGEYTLLANSIPIAVYTSKTTDTETIIATNLAGVMTGGYSAIVSGETLTITAPVVSTTTNPIALTGSFTITDDIINNLELQFISSSSIYANIKNAIANEGIVVPPSGAIAGVYAAVDGSRGVWKAPANVSLNTVIEPMVNIDDNMQGDLNIDVIGGKSVNAIRAFTGKGIYVWGARTLTGNDNDFRYISVRRFFIMVEESVKLAAYQFVFEPNDAKTWTRIRAMIENYLTNLWRLGALAGSKPEASFWVKVGLGQTMTFQDILEGRMIVEIGMAPVRPAEFIILRFTQIQQTS